jgi:hypothetical protein
VSPRTPLLRPDRYFAERDPNGIHVLAIVALLTLAGLGTVYGIGWILTAHIDGTVMVDNPGRPPDWVCDDSSGLDTFDKTGCDEPKEVERNVDRIIRSATGEFVGPGFIAFPLALLLTGLLLHGGVRLVDGDHGIGTTFAVTAWGLVPVVVSAAVVLVAIYVSLDPVTVTPQSDPERAIGPIVTQLRAVQPISTAATLVTAVWSGVIWRFGLEHEQGLSKESAWLVAGTVAGLSALVGLA